MKDRFAGKSLFRRHKWLRRCLKCLVILALLLVCLYQVENWRGRRSLEQAIAAYEAAGESFDTARMPVPKVPDAENFCATPLLDGIMALDSDDAAASERALQKAERLFSLIKSRGAKAKWRWDGRRFGAGGEVPVAMDWKELRRQLHQYESPAPPADEPSDVRAVYLALESVKPVFDELISAARRPHSLFTPRELRLHRKHFRAALDLGFGVNAPLHKLSVLLYWRARAAAALGFHAEAVGLCRVLWKLSNAWAAESRDMGIHHHNREYWRLVATDIFSDESVPAGMLGDLLTQTASWSPETEMLRHLRCAMISARARFAHSRSAVSGRFFYSREFKEPGPGDYFGPDFTCLYGPAGWVDQQAADHILSIGTQALVGLRDRGAQALPSVFAAWERQAAVRFAWLNPCTDQEKLHTAGTQKYVIFRMQRLRLTMLALGMNSYRERYGAYPSDAAALAPDFLPQIPPDLDAAPLRAVTAPDRKSAVLYSVGWNRMDDWGGVRPAEAKGLERDSADWLLEIKAP